MELPITLIRGDKVSSKTDYCDNLPVNMIAVERSILGAQGYMLQYPGLSSFTTGSGIDRGGIYNERHEAHYRVSGQKMIKIDEFGTVTELGDVSGMEQVTLEGFYSFDTQAVIADGKMFLYDSTNGFREVTDTDLGSPIDGVWIDNYYFMTDGEYIFHTDVDDETSVDPLKFATAEFMPDESLGVGKTADNKAMVFGRYTIEFFSDQANANFAFTRIETRAMKIGIVATHAKCYSGNIWYILGGGKNESVVVYKLSAGISKKISTREIDKIIKEYTEPELSDVRIEKRFQDDIELIIINLPNETLCYNNTIAQKFGDNVAWTILKTDTQGDVTYRAINGVFDPRNGKWIYGDKRDSTIGYIDDSIATHYGDKVEWILYSPFVGLETYSIDKIEIQTIPGHTSEEDATVAMSITTDGVGFGAEHWMDYGDPHEYGQRFILYRLGYVREWLGFKFRGISASRMAFALMNLEYN